MKQRGNDSRVATVIPLFDEEEESLERLSREGARKILATALELEVDEFLGRLRYERAEPFRGYRNGYAKPRQVAVGFGRVEVRVPRVREVPEDVAPFASQIIAEYDRTSETTRQLFTELYLEGLSSRDFEPVFRQLLGDTAPLSASAILRLKAVWQQEYDAWRTRPLQPCYAYVWADGVYLKSGPKADKTAILTVVGVAEDGRKVLLALHEGYRESTASWAELLRDLKGRGVAEIRLLIGDGNLGLWAAVGEVFPSTRGQRCWNHKALNVLDKLPKRLQRQVKTELRDVWTASTRTECVARAERVAQRLRRLKQEAAADTVLRDLLDFVTFYDFPQAHWKHLRTTNPIESIFAGVRLRTNVTKRMQSPRTTLYLVFKTMQRLAIRWRPVDAPALVARVLANTVFQDGIEVEPRTEVKPAA